MSILSKNIRYLREQLAYSQQRVADDLVITRGRYAKYEEDASEPPLEILLRMSRYYHVSIDLMASVDLSRIPLKEILALPDNRILLPITVDGAGNNKIEIIPHKATMGYLTGYSDPEYIESLQSISLPFLGGGKYRAFPAGGDSMPPHKDGSYIIGRYVEQLQDLKQGKGYVFVTRSEGITYKKFSVAEEDGLRVSADNVLYEPYTIPYTDVLEVWQYACSIATTEFSKGDFQADGSFILQALMDLKKEIKLLKGNGHR